MYSQLPITVGCIALVIILACALWQWSRVRRTAPRNGVRRLPPDEFCRQVITAKPPRMVILQVGDHRPLPGKVRRYEFRVEEPKSGRTYCTYYDDASASADRKVSRPVSQNMRRTVGHIQLLMKAADWHFDNRKGILANPAFYLEL